MNFEKKLPQHPIEPVAEGQKNLSSSDNKVTISGVRESENDAAKANTELNFEEFASKNDPLLEVLQYLCKGQKKPFSAATACQGLVLREGVLRLDQFVGAAENVGISAKIIARKPAEVSALVIPFIVLFKSGEVGVALQKSSAAEQLKIQIPGTEPRWISYKILETLALDMVIYQTRQSSNYRDSPNQVEPGNGHWLWSVVAKFWSNWFNVALAALIINLLGLALPLFVMNVYDRVIPNNSIATLWALSAGVLIAVGFDFLLRMLRSVVIDNSGRRIDMKVSAVLFRQALDIKMKSRTGRAGDTANQIREFESVRDFFTSASLTSAIDLLFIGVFLSVLWLIVGPLAIVPLVAVPVVIIVTLLIQVPLAKSVAQAQASTSNRHSILIESLVGIETVKTISAEGVMQKRWDEAVAGSVKASSATKFWSSLAIYFSTFVQQLVSVGVIVWGVFLVAENTITIGALIASNILAGRVLAPLGGIAMTIARAQQSFLSLRQLNQLMELEGDHKSSQQTGAVVKSADLNIKDLEFAYPEQKLNALEISALKILPGERVGIIGRVGSGKSTIGKILCALYQPDSGIVHLDGSEIGQYSMSDLRQAVYYVGQDPELFTGNLQENLLFSRAENSRKYQAAISISGVDAFAQLHPHGYEMQVGERGKNLSGGQRQAVALARAMMGSPKMLFLDEPTSSMDNLSEAIFVQGFRQWLSADITLIIATHRHSLLDLVDRIIILDKGKIIADGPRDKILKQLKKQKPASTKIKEAKK